MLELRRKDRLLFLHFRPLPGAGGIFFHNKRINVVFWTSENEKKAKVETGVLS